jgi:hypothetical protein
MAETDDEFERERERAIEDLQREEVLSFYVGTILDEDDGQAIEYRLRTKDVDPELRSNVNLTQAAMVLTVIAEEADASLMEVAEASVQRAKAEHLPQQV